MRVVPGPSVPAERWDDFVLRHPEGWFWHRRGWLEYQVHFCSGNADLSLAVLDDDGRLVGVAPLVVHQPPGRPLELSYSGDPLAEPICRGQAARALADAEVRRLARWHGAARRVSAPSPFRETVGDSPPGPSHRLVDLDELAWSQVRESYRSPINRATREHAISFSPGLRLTDDGAKEAEQLDADFVDYVSLHRRLTNSPRADATYGFQRQWLDEGSAAVCVARRDGIAWGAAYWFAWKGCAYYGSGAYAAPDVGKAITWHCLLRLRSQVGVRVASLGWQGTAGNDKERGIEMYKRGYGGRDVPCPITLEELR